MVKANEMITGKVHGRLANALFQTAMVYCYAKKHGLPWCMPHDKYDDLFPNIPYGPEPKGATHYKDPRPHQYRELPKHNSVVFDGWWQSYKYYDGYWDDLRNLFGFESKPLKGIVSIHVRRGDYLDYQESFPVLPGHYYDAAIKSFKDNGLNKFRVYSDDIPWCRQFFKHEGCEFSFSEGAPKDDLFEMANCDHHIIANSSFSQLAALMNPSKEKIVISPALTQWYGKKNRTYTKDMIPMDWIQIKY